MTRISRRGAIAREDGLFVAPSALFPFFDDFSRSDAILTDHDGVTYIAGYGLPLPWAADNKLKANATPAETDNASLFVDTGSQAQRLGYDIIVPGNQSGGTTYLEIYLRCTDPATPTDSAYFMQLVGSSTSWDMAIVKFVSGTPTYLAETTGHAIGGTPAYMEASIDVSGNIDFKVMTTLGGWALTATDNDLTGTLVGCDTNGTMVLDNLQITLDPPPTPTLVQSAFTDDPGSEVASQTCVFADDVTPGNVVFVAILTYPSTGTPVVSGLGADWHRQADPVASDSAGYDLWVGVGATGGDTVTVTATGHNMENMIAVAEFANVHNYLGTGLNYGISIQGNASTLTTVQSCASTGDFRGAGMHMAPGMLAVGGYWTNNEVNPPSTSGDPLAVVLTDESLGTWALIHDPTEAATGNSGFWLVYTLTPDATSQTVDYAATTSRSVLSTGATVLMPPG